jgi:hypothetical protein
VPTHSKSPLALSVKMIKLGDRFYSMYKDKVSERHGLTYDQPLFVFVFVLSIFINKVTINSLLEKLTQYFLISCSMCCRCSTSHIPPYSKAGKLWSGSSFSRSSSSAAATNLGRLSDWKNMNFCCFCRILYSTFRLSSLARKLSQN